jgi:hypothetical protein
MHFNYDLSIIVPAIRQEHWIKLYHQTAQACKRYTFEFIIAGPYQPPADLHQLPNVKYVKDLGTPSRSFHVGTLIAEGKFLTWLSDDAYVYEDSIDLALDLLMSKNPEKDIVTMRYSEGPNHSGQAPPDAYWTAAYHADLNLPGIERHWKICCVMMLSSEFYRCMGGLDCSFEHINMNVHDLAFRAQRFGSQIHLSPTLIMNCDFDTGRTPENSAVISAYYNNDGPKFKEMYLAPNKRPLQIDPESWRNTEVVWSRRK